MSDRPRRLRATATPLEVRLWQYLRDRRLDGLKFRRQHPVGPYVLDFYCAERQLAVELDGSQHLDSQADEARDRWLSTQGIRVVRVWNNQLASDLPAVLQRIVDTARTG